MYITTQLVTVLTKHEQARTIVYVPLSVIFTVEYLSCASPQTPQTPPSPPPATPPADEPQGVLGAEEPCSTVTGPTTGLQSEGPAPPTGPGGLEVVGRLLQKHSYVSGLIIMMVRETPAL